MKLFQKYLFLSLLLSAALLQSCGGGKTDTSGSLSLSSPQLTNNNDGFYTIKTTATFSPPAGKVPNGVVIDFVATYGVSTIRLEKTLTASPVVDVSFRIPQSTASSVPVIITASIGDMESSVIATIPVLGAVNAAPVQFSETDVAFTTKTSTISGGIPPYTLQSPANADLNASIAVNIFTVEKRSAAGLIQTTENFIILDSLGNAGTVQVNYFK